MSSSEPEKFKVGDLVYCLKGNKKSYRVYLGKHRYLVVNSFFMKIGSVFYNINGFFEYSKANVPKEEEI